MKHLHLKTVCHQAFTMIELMVTLLIVGILTAVATAGYNTYTNKIRLAEASTTLDLIGKSEVTYYLTSKTFVSLTVPTTDGLIPSGGSKVQVSSTALSSLTTGSTAPWDTLGKPIPNGSMISYKYWIMAGKNNPAGTSLTGTSPFDLYEANVTNNYIAMSFQNPTAGPSRCILDFKLADFFHPNAGIADKGWLVMYAIANFNNSSTDTWTPTGGSSSDPSSGECTQITKYIETTNGGNISTGHGLVIDHLGN